MTTPAFWKATGERAVKTAAQVVLTLVGADLVNAFSLPWTEVAGVGLGAALVSVLTSLASSQVGLAGPSLAGETVRRPG